MGVIQQAWTQFLDQMVSMLPHVLASVFVFTSGVLVGIVVKGLTNRVLASSRIDYLTARLGLSLPLEALGVSSTGRLVGHALQWAIMIAASILALYSLDARLGSDLAERLILYVPNLAAAVAILAVGVVSSRFLARNTLIACVNHEMPSARLLSSLTRVGVMIVATAMALEHLGIGRATVQAAFAILFGGATLAASIALGLGLQDVVRRWVAIQFETEPVARAEADPIQHW